MIWLLLIPPLTLSMTDSLDFVNIITNLLFNPRILDAGKKLAMTYLQIYLFYLVGSVRAGNSFPCPPGTIKIRQRIDCAFSSREFKKCLTGIVQAWDSSILEFLAILQSTIFEHLRTPIRENLVILNFLSYTTY